MELLTMPDDVLIVIIEKLDFSGIQTLRKVCHHLRNTIDEIGADPNIFSMELIIKPDAIEVIYDRSGDEVRVEYQTNEKGCLVVYQDKKKLLENEGFMKVTIHDLELNLRDQKSYLYQFTITTALVTDQKNNPIPFLNLFENMLKSRTRPVQTEEFIMKPSDQNELLLVLPYLDLKTLETLNVSPSAYKDAYIEFKIDQLMQLDHWRNVKMIRINQFINLEVFFQYFEHFETIFARTVILKAADLTRIKEVFFRSSNMETFYIRYRVLNETQPFGIATRDPNAKIDHEEEWYFAIPNSGKVLSIVHSLIYRVFDFDLIDREKVPNYATVQV